MLLSLFCSVSLTIKLLTHPLIIFAAYLRLNGVKARDHPVFIELTRVRQYFEKIKAAEKPGGERNLTLDKGAASRIIRAGLVSVVEPSPVASVASKSSPP